MGMSERRADKRKAFINEFIKDHNGTQAAIRAGYGKAGARVTASRLLANTNISNAVKALVDERSMKAEEVLTRLADMARGDIADLLDISTAGYSFKLLTRDEKGDLVTNPNTKLIKKIKQKVTTTLSKAEDGEDKEFIETELELYSAQEALALLGKHHKLFTDKTDINVTGSIDITSEKALEFLKRVYGDNVTGSGTD